MLSLKTHKILKEIWLWIMSFTGMIGILVAFFVMFGVVFWPEIMKSMTVSGNWTVGLDVPLFMIGYIVVGLMWMTYNSYVMSLDIESRQ